MHRSRDKWISPCIIREQFLFIVRVRYCYRYRSVLKYRKTKIKIHNDKTE